MKISSRLLFAALAFNLLACENQPLRTRLTVSAPPPDDTTPTTIGISTLPSLDAHGADTQAVAASDTVPTTSCVPSMVIPAEGQILDNGRTDGCDTMDPQLFSWTTCAMATEYNLYVAITSFATPSINADVSGNSLTTSSGGYAEVGPWTARVRAKIDGVWGDWSEARSFQYEPVNTDPPRPGCLSGQ